LLLAGVVLVAVHVTVVGMVVMVVIVVGMIVDMGVLDAVRVRVHVQMRWIGCGLVLGHGNLDTAGPGAIDQLSSRPKNGSFGGPDGSEASIDWNRSVRAELRYRSVVISEACPRVSRIVARRADERRAMGTAQHPRSRREGGTRPCLLPDSNIDRRHASRLRRCEQRLRNRAAAHRAETRDRFGHAPSRDRADPRPLQRGRELWRGGPFRHTAGDILLTGKTACMKIAGVSLLLLLAACLEVAGDAIVRVGLKSHTGLTQLALVVLGGVVLLAYGIFVNVAPADFGRLLGVYVVLFFPRCSGRQSPRLQNASVPPNPSRRRFHHHRRARDNPLENVATSVVPKP